MYALTCVYGVGLKPGEDSKTLAKYFSVFCANFADFADKLSLVMYYIIFPEQDICGYGNCYLWIMLRSRPYHFHIKICIYVCVFACLLDLQCIELVLRSFFRFHGSMFN